MSGQVRQTYLLPNILRLLSIPIAFLAYDPSYLPARFQPYIPSSFQTYLNLAFAPSDQIYCYDSITTLDSANSTSHTCLTVHPNGTFGRIFTPSTAAESQSYNYYSGHVIPGLWDAHGHIMGYGEMLDSVQLYDTRSLHDVRKAISEYLTLHPGSGTKDNWIKGIGWDQAHFPNGDMPSASDLPSDLYIMLDRVDVHCTWVSSAVLSLLPSPLPSPPPGGTHPSPGVFCDNAMDLVLSYFPTPSEARQRSRLLATQDSLHTYGLVGVHDAGARPNDISLFASTPLSLRIHAMLECPIRNTFCAHLQERMHTPTLSVTAVKLFADGALGSHGAALQQPYSDAPEERGTMLINATALSSVTRSWARAGWGVNIHAIGDYAALAALDAMHDATAVGSDARFRLEHAQIVAPADQARMAALGVTASIQPTHATSDSAYALDRLGTERLGSSAYRMRSFLHKGIAVALGSDFPVEPPSPLAGMYAAVERRDPKDPGEQFYLQETLSLWEALWGFTRAPAEAAGMENWVGRIEEGWEADWVVIPRKWGYGDGEGEGSNDWLRSREAVKETWVAGKKVYSQKEDA
ncbi:amidohydrolase family-domain-containing protein [Geopyxis carbonaria]|nr:amidohydrolase family-domain-containing protein [Geopyxis carbonaria]